MQFYATFCKYCKALVPEFKKLAKTQHGVGAIKVGAVDTVAETALKARYVGVGGTIPKILIFGANKRSPKHYDGKRTASSIAAAANFRTG